MATKSKLLLALGCATTPVAMLSSGVLAAGPQLRLAHVGELRSGPQAALVARVSGLAPSGRVEASLYATPRGCVPGAAEEGGKGPYRRVAVEVSGRFQPTVSVPRLARGLWSGHLCAYLESPRGLTLARAARHYTIATYRNPVYPRQFPDPMVLDVGGVHRDYYAYGSGDGIPMLHSRDLVRWRPVGRALIRRPSWVVRSGHWAAWGPSVLESARACPGAKAGPCFIMYYGAVSARLRIHCIAVATSRRPDGPFADRGVLEDLSAPRGAPSRRPAGCGDGAGYSNIDPDPFIDENGTGYLYLSTGRACSAGPGGGRCRWRPTISVLPLRRDLLHADGPRRELFSGQRGTWEQAPWGVVVEGPWMARRGRTYFLFYSGGSFRGRYGMGLATASSPTGPFVKSTANPLLRGSATVLSAGGGSLITGPSGGSWMVYAGRSRSPSRPRLMRIDRVWWRGDRPSVAGPTDTPQAPVP